MDQVNADLKSIDTVEKNSDFRTWKLLSGIEIAAYRGTKNAELPQRGIKESIPDGSWLQGKRLQKAYEERKEVLSEPKVERKGSLSFGKWCPRKRKVSISQTKGKYWERLGHYELGQLYLYPEEALYLLDCGCIEISYGGIPISIQQSYSTFFEDGDIGLSEYQVYAHLNRLGFIVLRHKKSQKRKNDSMENVEKKKQKTTDSPSASYLMCSSDELLDGSHATECEASSNQVDLSDGNTAASFSDIHPVNESPMDETNAPTEGVGQCDTTIDSQTGKCTTWDFNSMEFPDIGNQTGVYNVHISHDSETLPMDIGNRDCMYSINVDKYLEKNRPKKRSEYATAMEFSCHGFTRWKSQKSKARNWRELKQEMQTHRGMFNSPVSHLWTGDVTPLIKPEDALSTASVLNKLQVIEEVSFSKCAPENLCRDFETVKITFDVYSPGGKFRKTQPGSPAFRVCVMSFTDEPPELSTIAQVISASDNDVPVMWAIEDNGDISFYCYHDVNLTVDVVMG